MDPNRSQKRIYSLADEKGVVGLNSTLRLISEDLATLQGQNGPAKIGDRYDLTSERNDTNLTLKSGTDFNTDMVQLKSSDGTVRSSFDNQGRFWNKFSSPWEELVIPFHSMRVDPALTYDPSYTGWDGGAPPISFAQTFSAANTEILWWETQMPHNWKEGSPIYPRIHWMPETTNTGNVVWGIAIYALGVGTAFSAVTYAQNTIVAGSGTALMHQVADFPAMPMLAGYNTVGTVLTGRLSRSGANASDTFTGLAYGLTLTFAYEVDSLGSRGQWVK